ncbi:hypothetical protein RDI58_020092 [Solanum bulbocastanum]|uniref:Response regulatory domain-containing protein n=1 Tax=Solanum bulbocastanum TaxID=147425 RepID=A0AAN8TBF4_SOLBU
MATPFYGMIETINVLLVDNDQEFITNIIDLLKSYDYKVMAVGTTSTAMSMLSKGKQKIDVMIINIHPTNMISVNLLTQAMTLDVISVGCGTFGTEIRNATINKYNLNANADKVSDTYVGSATFNELGVANTNFQQYIGEPNMSNSSSIIGTSYVNDIEGSDSNKKKNCNAYFDFNNMDYLFQNHGPSSSNT